MRASTNILSWLYHTFTNYLMELTEKVQYQAALAVTGAWQGTDRVKLYEELGWESLTDRRLYRRILQMHKIFDGQTPSYLREKLPPNRNSLVNLPNVFQPGAKGWNAEVFE